MRVRHTQAVQAEPWMNNWGAWRPTAKYWLPVPKALETARTSPFRELCFLAEPANSKQSYMSNRRTARTTSTASTASATSSTSTASTISSTTSATSALYLCYGFPSWTRLTADLATHLALPGARY